MDILCFQQYPASELHISEWSSDVCSSALKKVRFGLDNKTLLTECAEHRTHGHFGISPITGRIFRQKARRASKAATRSPRRACNRARKSAVSGKSVSVRVDHGGRRLLKNKHTAISTEQNATVHQYNT